MPARIGFHAAHEIFPPDRLLALAERAGEAGFEGVLCSDHARPWTTSQGHSGFAWTWLGAAAARLRGPLGTVTAVGSRYPLPILAQAVATAACLAPGRFWTALGTGEALNETITDAPWPPKPQRRAALRQAVDALRALFAGQTVHLPGRARSARLFTRPAAPPPLYGAALTAETARWAGSWADGLLTGAQDFDGLRRLIDAFREGGGDGKPVAVQVLMAWGRDEAALAAWVRDRWPVAGLDGTSLQDLETPEAFEQAAAGLSDETRRKAVRMTSDLRRLEDWLQRDVEAGATELYLHNVGPDPEGFLDEVAKAGAARLIGSRRRA